jgi:hypothetical protein
VIRLGTYIDVLQIHRLDHDTPPEEIMRALNDVVESGKVRYIGASSVSCSFLFCLFTPIFLPLFPSLVGLKLMIVVVDGNMGISKPQPHRRKTRLAPVHQHAELPQLAL